MNAAPDINIDDANLIELRATNFKKLKAVRIRVDGSVIQITGPNDAGKTSVLDAFAAAVGGKAFKPKNPIRKGELKAEVFADLDSIRVTRRWWRDTPDGEISSAVEVVNRDGSKPKQPQSTLDRLRGTDIAFDPVEFMRMPAKDQFDILKSLVPGVDFADIAKRRQELFDKRTQAGRDRDREKGAADAIRVPANTPLKLVDIAEVLAELREVSEANALLARTRAARSRAEQEIETGQNEVDAMRIQIRELTKRADQLDTTIAAAQRKLDDAKPLGPDFDTDDLQQKISTAEVTNANVRLLHQQDQHRASMEGHVEEYQRLTDEIAALDDEKNRAIEKAKLPVSNMSFGTDEILMNGVSFSDASKAHQIRAGIAIAMALKPKLKVILLYDGSLLDKESMKALAEIIAANKFVAIIERVAVDGGPVGVVIEDGEVVS